MYQDAEDALRAYYHAETAEILEYEPDRCWYVALTFYATEDDSQWTKTLTLSDSEMQVIQTRYVRSCLAKQGIYRKLYRS